MQSEDRRGSPHSLLLPFAGAAALVLALLIARGVPHGPPTAPTLPISSAGPIPVAIGDSTIAGPAPTAPSLPAVKSWQGTDIEGDIHLDAAGNVVPDEDLHELFDYLLSASNVLKPEQIRQQLLVVGRQHVLSDPSLNQLDALFARYNAYRQAAAVLPVDESGLDGMKHSFEARHRLREQTLGPQMADAFFADSEAQDRYQLAVLDVENDKTLSDDERQRRLAALKTDAPADIIAARQPSETLQTLESRTEALRKAGADDSQIESLRIQTVGPEAAARMHALDEENAAWNQRMQALRQVRAQILTDAGIAQTDKQRAIDDYIDKNFSGPQAIRARALLSLDQAST